MKVELSRRQFGSKDKERELWALSSKSQRSSWVPGTKFIFSNVLTQCLAQ